MHFVLNWHFWPQNMWLETWKVFTFFINSSLTVSSKYFSAFGHWAQVTMCSTELCPAMVFHLLKAVDTAQQLKCGPLCHYKRKAKLNVLSHWSPDTFVCVTTLLAVYPQQQNISVWEIQTSWQLKSCKIGPLILGNSVLLCPKTDLNIKYEILIMLFFFLVTQINLCRKIQNSSTQNQIVLKK